MRWIEGRENPNKRNQWNGKSEQKNIRELFWILNQVVCIRFSFYAAEQQAKTICNTKRFWYSEWGGTGKKFHVKAFPRVTANEWEKKYFQFVRSALFCFMLFLQLHTFFSSMKFFIWSLGFIKGFIKSSRVSVVFENCKSGTMTRTIEYEKHGQDQFRDRKNPLNKVTDLGSGNKTTPKLWTLHYSW